MRSEPSGDITPPSAPGKRTEGSTSGNMNARLQSDARLRPERPGKPFLTVTFTRSCGRNALEDSANPPP